LPNLDPIGAGRVPRAGKRIAGGRCNAYAERQMNAKAKLIYLFLSSEKDFAAFSRILKKTQKPTDTIDSVAHPVFSMVS